MLHDNDDDDDYVDGDDSDDDNDEDDDPELSQSPTTSYFLEVSPSVQSLFCHLCWSKCSFVKWPPECVSSDKLSVH